MQFRTYREFHNELTDLLPGWDIVFGTTKDSINGQTCFITHRDSTLAAADGQTMVKSSTYDLVFLQKRAAFTNIPLIEMLDGGVRFIQYDDESGLNIFAGQVTLFGPRSVPDE